MRVLVSLSLNLAEPLTYEWKGGAAEISPGTRVIVPLGPRIVPGWILGEGTGYSGSVKPVLGKISNGFFPGPRFMSFVQKVSEAFFVSSGFLMDLALPASQKSVRPLMASFQGKPEPTRNWTFPQWLHRSADGPLDLFFPQEPSAENHAGKESPAHGSRADRLYLGYERNGQYRAVSDQILAAGDSVLMVVPDLLTGNFIEASIPRFDPFHSKLPSAKRETLRRRAESGEPMAVVGSLSSLFLPFPRLGAVIIDRAGSSRYHASFHSHLQIEEIARIRAGNEGALLLEGAAAMTLSAAARKEKVEIEDTRPSEPPRLEVRMLKRGRRTIPDDLVEAVLAEWAEGRRTWVILPRRSSIRYLYCRSCDRIADCPDCGAPLRADGGPGNCSRCADLKNAGGSCRRCGNRLDSIAELGMESLAQALTKRVPADEMVVMEGKEEGGDLADAPKLEDIRLLFSSPRWITPVMKGRFQTVFFVRPESLFRMNRFRSAERIFSTIGELREAVHPGGRVIVYSAFHFHYSLQLAAREEEFWNRELKYREWFRLPPFASVFLLQVQHRDLRALAGEMRTIRREIGGDISIARCSLESRRPIRGKYRGFLELHGEVAAVKHAGLHSRRGTVLKRQME